MKQRTFKPYRMPGRKGYSVTFWHPIYKKQINRGLGTTEAFDAEIICRDLRYLCSHPETWDDPSILGRDLDNSARHIFFGSPGSQELPATQLNEPLTVAAVASDLWAGPHRHLASIVIRDRQRFTRLFSAWCAFSMVLELCDKHKRPDILVGVAEFAKAVSVALDQAEQECQQLQRRLRVAEGALKKPKKSKRKK